MTPALPPGWARGLVRRLLAPADREALLDDLDEGYGRRRARGRRALGWYLAQGVHAAATRRHPVVLPPAQATTRGAMRTSLTADIVASFRGFRRQPGAVAIIVLSLALGIGAASAMFTVTRAVLLTPLPYGQPDGLVTVWTRWTSFTKTWISSQELLDFRDRSRTLEDVAAWDTTRVTLTGLDEAVRVGAALVTPNTFGVLGVRPVAGRDFTAADAPSASDTSRSTTVVIGYGLWQRAFGGDPAVVGRTIDVDGASARVIGVMPKGFRLPTDFGVDAAEPTELWQPVSITPANAQRGSHYLYAAARLRPGSTAAQADEDVARVMRDLTAEGQYPPERQYSALAVSVPDEVLGGVRPALVVLMGAVGFLLLIACANAGALLLARAEARHREFATRSALGASRFRLVRQQLVEGALVAVAAGGLGVGLAFAARRALDAFGPTAIPRAGDVAVDGLVLAFLVGASTVAALLCALPPAIRALRLDLVHGLKDGGTRASAGRARLRLRHALVVAQVALAVVLLSGAGLMLRSLWSLQRIDLGFRPEGALTARIAVPSRPYDTAARQEDFFRRVLTGVRALPGVEAAGLVRSLPLGAQIGDWGVRVEGYTPPQGENAKGDWQVITDGALAALGARVVHGRDFTAADTAESMPVALVNETMASAYWPGGDAIGGRFVQGGSPDPVTVVGIVADIRHNGVEAPIKTKFYRPYAQFAEAFEPLGGGTLVARTTGDPLALAAPIRGVVRALDPGVPLAAVRPLDAVVATALTAPRLTSTVLGAFAVVALLLGAIGIYGLLAFVVEERSHELGIRMAVGARGGQIISLVVRHGVTLAAAGAVAGSAVAAVATRAIASQLHGVSPLDPASFVAAPAILIATAVVASLIPAWRGARVDPVVTLRR
ncbi:MAG: ABC transporter permease [Vicinamibacterales bacterium]